jgi:arylsulfatase
MLPVSKNGKGKSHEYMYWEHEDTCAIRWGKWKAVKKLTDKTWELYDMQKDPTENHNVAGSNTEKIKKLDRNGIIGQTAIMFYPRVM